MQPIAITGFLGSGKTSLIIPLAHQLLDHDKTVVILENEVGQTSIDGQRLLNENLQVREIAAGCICCTMAGDLTAALIDIHQKFNPDYLILEPSGVASPVQLNTVFEGLEDIPAPRNITLLDGPRWPSLIRRAKPFITGSLQATQLAMITKSDLISETQQQAIRNEIAQLTPGLPVQLASAHTQQGIADLIEWIMSPDPSPPSASPQHTPGLDHASCSRTFEFFRPDAYAHTTDALEALLTGLAQSLHLNRESPLGHLKLALAHAHGTLFANMDRFDAKPGFAGNTRTNPARGTLTITAIIMDAQKSSLCNALDQGLATWKNSSPEHKTAPAY